MTALLIVSAGYLAFLMAIAYGFYTAEQIDPNDENF